MSAKQKAEGRRFQTSATYVNPEADQMDPESITEQHGYIPLKTQVKILIDSGRFLDAYRKEYYDTTEVNDMDIIDEFLDEEDPTLDPAYDMAEASMLALELEEKARVLARRAKEAKKASQKEQNIQRERPKKSDETLREDVDKNVK